MPLWSDLLRASRLCSAYWVFYVNPHGVYQPNQRGGEAEQLLGTSVQLNSANKLFMMAADVPAFALCQSLLYGLSSWAIPPSCKFQCRQKLFKLEKLDAGAQDLALVSVFKKANDRITVICNVTMWILELLCFPVFSPVLFSFVSVHKHWGVCGWTTLKFALHKVHVSFDVGHECLETGFLKAVIQPSGTNASMDFHKQITI